MDDSIDLIERYFEDSLSPEELKSFRSRLETDEAFAEAFELEKSLIEGIEVMGNKNLKEDLKVYYKEEVEQKGTPTKSRRLSRRTWLSMAASIALLILAVWWMNRPTPERLYREYFQPEFNLVERNVNNELNQKTQTALREGQYQKALPLLDEISNTTPNNPDIQLSKAIALLETKKYVDARALFLQLNSNPLYKNKANWYNALSYLKQGDIKNSIKILKTLNQDPQVKELINKLEKLEK